MPNYQQSDFYINQIEQTPRIPHQDLESISFPDETFDVVITSDIFEHIRRPAKAFKEISRILVPGGTHIFTVPAQGRLPRKTIKRVEIVGDFDNYILPAQYHGNGKGGKSLVYNQFGVDVIEKMEKVGLMGEIISHKLPLSDDVVHTFYSKKIKSDS